MRRLLLISTSFPPPSTAGAARMLKLLKWLPRHGWQPSLLTISQERLPLNADRLPGDPDPVHRVAWRSWRARIPRATAYAGDAAGSAGSGTGFWPPLRRSLSRAYQNVFEFPDRYHAWIRPAVTRGLELTHAMPFDLLYSSTGLGVSAHFVAAEIQRQCGIPWVHEYRDLWAGNPWRDVRAYAWRDRRERAWERRFLKQAAGAIVMNAANAGILATRCQADKCCPISIVPNGFDADEFPADVPVPKGLPLRLCYTGSLYGGKRDLSGLFAALRMLVDRGVLQRHEIQFVYAGASSAEVHAAAARAGVADMIQDHGLIPADEAKRLQKTSHLLVLVEADDDDPWVRDNISAKAYEYLGAARPILALAHPGGALAALLTQTRTGQTFRPADINRLAAHLTLLIGSVRSTGQIPFSPDPQAVSAHEWKARSEMLAGVLEKGLNIKLIRK
jgi:hypothetical protein